MLKQSPLSEGCLETDSSFMNGWVLLSHFASRHTKPVRRASGTQDRFFCAPKKQISANEMASEQMKWNPAKDLFIIFIFSLSNWNIRRRGRYYKSLMTGFAWERHWKKAANGWPASRKLKRVINYNNNATRKNYFYYKNAICCSVKFH